MWSSVIIITAPKECQAKAKSISSGKNKINSKNKIKPPWQVESVLLCYKPPPFNHLSSSHQPPVDISEIHQQNEIIVSSCVTQKVHTKLDIVMFSTRSFLFLFLGRSTCGAFVVKYSTTSPLHLLPVSTIRTSSMLGHQLSRRRQLLRKFHYPVQLHSTSVVSDSSNCETLYQVHGITCREVRIDIDIVGPVSILEATADSQNDLVDMALLTEEEVDSMRSSDTSGTESLRLNSGDPYGAVLWPAASAVANHLLTTGDTSIKGKTILELGAGTGLVSIAAALGGMSKIMATDYENVPLELLRYAASHINHKRNCDDSDCTDDQIKERQSKLRNIETFLFDICDHDTPLPTADVVVAADIMYEPKTGIAMAHRVVEALKTGSRVIVGCSPGRYVKVFHVLKKFVKMRY